MSPSLPKAPNLEQLRKQAKDLLKAHRAGDADACEMLRRLRRFENASDGDILAADVALNDAQHALAKAYGFEQWTDLKRHVESPAGEGSPVRNKDGRVWIDAVPQLRWGKSGECTFAGALSAALAVTERPATYRDIMGYAGLAFRVRWYRDFDEPDWCPSSPVGEMSEEILAVANALGWRIRQISRMGRDNQDVSAYADRLAASIDAGRPIVGYPDSDLNVGVCFGYERDGDATSFVWNGYNRDDAVIPANKVGPWLMLLEETGTPPPPRENLKCALTTPNWRREQIGHWNPKPDQNVAYLYGPHALKQWSDDLGMAESFTPDQRKTLFFVSWWCFDCLIDARGAAVRFLKERQADAPEEARPALQRAIEAYGRGIDAAVETVFTERAAFFGPWSGKKIDGWTPEVREREQQVLGAIAEADAAALAEIDAALEAFDPAGA